MARRVVESAPLRGRDACARLRVFAIDELTGRDSYEARRAEGSKKSTRLSVSYTHLTLPTKRIV